MGYSSLNHLVSPSSQWGSAHVATDTSINMTDVLWGKQGVIINGQLPVFSCYFTRYIYIYTHIYRIVPNRRAVREWEGLGARLLISQKWDECGHPLDQIIN